MFENNDRAYRPNFDVNATENEEVDLKPLKI